MFAALLLLISADASSEVNTMLQADGEDHVGLQVGGNTDRYDLVVMGDGFTSAEQGLFNQQADLIVTALENTPPFSDSSCALNIWRINVVSSGSGIDDVGNGQYVDTELDVRRGLRTLGEVPRGYYSDSMETIYEAADLAPDYDGILVLANHADRGGTAFGEVVIMGTGSDMQNIAIHELGHSLGGLADEYSCYYCDGSDDGRAFPANGTEPAEPNATIDLALATTKWADLIDSTTPLPTTEDMPPGIVGLWEGARYYATGIYRPRFSCRMLESAANSFCPVCERYLSDRLGQPCLTEVTRPLPRFEKRILYPGMLPLIRWPIPVCLSCPFDKTSKVELSLQGIQADGMFRVVSDDSAKNTGWRNSNEEGELQMQFSTLPTNQYYLEFRHQGTVGYTTKVQEVSFSSQLHIGGKAHPLPDLSRK